MNLHLTFVNSVGSRVLRARRLTDRLIGFLGRSCPKILRRGCAVRSSRSGCRILEEVTRDERYLIEKDRLSIRGTTTVLLSSFHGNHLKELALRLPRRGWCNVGRVVGRLTK